MRLSLIVLLALCSFAAQAQLAPRLVLASPDETQESLFGTSLAPIGDLDGDGVTDIAVSAPDEDAVLADSVVTDGGQLHVFSGTTGSFVRTFTSPNPEFDAFFGEGLLATSDRDGDGTPDFYVSASREVIGGADNAGRVYLLSGADGTEIASLASPDPQAAGDFGFDLARLGDLTGDGVGEIGVSAKGERVGDLPLAGRLHVFDGAADTLVFTVTAPDPAEESGFGYTSDDAGDLDGDGTPDIVTGEPFRTGPTGLQIAGRLYFVSGADGSVLRSIRSPNETQLGGFGRYVAGLGDVTGDGVPDVATGANGEPIQGEYLGRAYVISGATGEAAVTIESPDPQPIGFFGELVESAGDVDGDGREDLIVSARAEDDAADPQALIGRVYLFSSDGTLLQTYEPPTADPDGIQYFGYGIAALGDLDGDGSAEIGIGAWGENPPGSPPFAGRAYVFPTAMTTRIEATPEATPLALAVAPNPARGGATVTYTLVEAGPARVEVFDVLGRSVALLVDERQAAGTHTARAALGGLPAGLYVVRLRAGDHTETRHLTVIR